MTTPPYRGGRAGRAEQSIRDQLDAMDAQGLGDRSRVGGVELSEPSGPTGGQVGVREGWRLVAAAGFAVLGVALWLVGHFRPTPVADPFHPRTSDFAAEVDRSWNAGWHNLFLQITGVLLVVTAVVWLVGQRKPGVRTYTRTGIAKSVTAVVLAVGCAVAFYHGFDNATFSPHFLLIVPMLIVLFDTVTRTTGPDRERQTPRWDARLRLIRALTPFPVVVALALLYVGWQVDTILRR